MKALLLSSLIVFVGSGEIRGEDPYDSVPHEKVVSWCRLAPLPFDSRFDLPSGIVHLPDGTTVVACQKGMFHRVDLRDPSRSTTVFLDFRETMDHWRHFEEGVHGIALHPNFEENGRMFLSYTLNDPRRKVVSEMRVDVESDFTPLPETERIFFEHLQPLAEHWGGQIAFGPDGMLYLAIGDGGMRNDPYRMAQGLWNFHAKLLRIDVNRTDGACGYGIPPDNPFLGDQEVRPEIYAIGLRNPWGMAFDEDTGRLWVADVGQDLWEEINCIEKGGNYGWSDRDGPIALAAHPEPLLAEAKFRDPVFGYSRVNGDGICIIGGYVYRGPEFPELENCYLYADWGYGVVEAIELSKDGSRALKRMTLHRRLADSGYFNPTFVGADTKGEPIVLSQDGAVWALCRVSPPPLLTDESIEFPK